MPATPPATPKSSATVENYLEQIAALIDAKGYARAVDIAEALGISQASVTNMVKRLASEGFLDYEKYRGFVMTRPGEVLARNIARRHQLLTDFFRQLGLSERVIQQDVEGLEHHVSPSTLRAIEILSAQLDRQPALLAKLRSKIDAA